MIAFILSSVTLAASVTITRIISSKKREKQIRDALKWKKEANEELEKIGWKLI